MKRDQILEALTAIFSDVLKKPIPALQETSTAREIPGWDSLNHINIVLAVEQHFGIKLRAAQIAKLNDVAGFVDIILEKTSS